MDQQKLRSLVFDKTGIKVDSDDPIFALVALNDAVLAETVERHVARLETAARELAAQARAAGGLAPLPAETVAAPTAAATATATATIFDARERRLLAAIGAIALGAVLLALAGQAVFSKPAALTAQQSAALRDADNLRAALGKLEPKSRALLQAELDKLSP